MFLTPKGNTIIGAATTPQYEQTIRREIDNDIPAVFVDNVSLQKSYMDFSNGHRLTYRPFDDEGKLRSYNVTMFVIVEASEVGQDIYEQLKLRLRGKQALIEYRHPDIIDQLVQVDIREGIIESNPDPGWVRTEILEVADQIDSHGEVEDNFMEQRDMARLNRKIYAAVASSDVNPYLPKDFIEVNTKNKPLWWILRYLKGSFQYAEGLVYPGFKKAIIPRFDIPKSWRRVMAFDYGLSDDAAFIWGAIDPDKGELIIYREQVTNNRSLKELAKIYRDEANFIPVGGISFQLIDPKSGPRRDYNKQSLADLFLEEDIYFEPGVTSVDTRVFRLNTYIEAGKIKIFDDLEYLIGELKEYKFPERVIGKAYTNKPVDKNNHAINPVEWIVCALPEDPKHLILEVYNSKGISTKAERQIQNLPPPVYNPFDNITDYSPTGQTAPAFGQADMGIYGMNFLEVTGG